MPACEYLQQGLKPDKVGEVEGGVCLSFLAYRKREAIEPDRVTEDGCIALSVN